MVTGEKELGTFVSVTLRVVTLTLLEGHLVTEFLYWGPRRRCVLGTILLFATFDLSHEEPEDRTMH